MNRTNKKRIVKIFTFTILAIIILIIIAFGFIWYHVGNYEKETSPVIEENIEQEITTHIINYLNNKYGNKNFSVIEIKKDFTYNGGALKRHTGYEATVSSSVLKKNFNIHISGTDLSQINGVNENFIENYYNENVNEYLLQKYSLSFDIWIKEEYIPDDCGHLPTLDELVYFNAVDEIYINVYKTDSYKYDNNVNGRINHLKNLSKDLINYLNISKDITYTFTRYTNANSFRYNVLITKDTIKIINEDGKEICQFSTNE